MAQVPGFQRSSQVEEYALSAELIDPLSSDAVLS